MAEKMKKTTLYYKGNLGQYGKLDVVKDVFVEIHNISDKLLEVTVEPITENCLAGYEQIDKKTWNKEFYKVAKFVSINLIS